MSIDIVLALADGEKHGYAIMQAVEEETQGQMQIRTGSLYGSIRRMIEAGLVEETNERPDPELDDERRRYYGLTDFGRRVLTAEAAASHRRWRSSRGSTFWVGFEMRGELLVSERLFGALLYLYPKSFEPPGPC